MPVYTVVYYSNKNINYLGGNERAMEQAREILFTSGWNENTWLQHKLMTGTQEKDRQLLRTGDYASEEEALKAFSQRPNATTDDNVHLLIKLDGEKKSNNMLTPIGARTIAEISQISAGPGNTIKKNLLDSTCVAVFPYEASKNPEKKSKAQKAQDKLLEEGWKSGWKKTKPITIAATGRANLIDQLSTIQTKDKKDYVTLHLRGTLTDMQQAMQEGKIDKSLIVGTEIIPASAISSKKQVKQTSLMADMFPPGSQKRDDLKQEEKEEKKSTQRP